MKKTKVENISKLRLDFFLKQDKEDVRVVLKPGESSWCDHGSTTKSMILYERKKLIKSGPYSNRAIEPKEEITASVALELVPVQSMKSPDKELFLKITSDTLTPIGSVSPLVDPPEFTTETLTPLEKAEKETEEYKQESEKKYKGKKRGRKKKRGPKPGSKRSKGGDNTTTTPESPIQ